jgi:hypothetical protein
MEMPRNAMAILACFAPTGFLAWTHRSGRESVPAGSKAPRFEEDDVKELSPEEVLRIAGGVPLSAALDELTYRAPEEHPGADDDASHFPAAVPRPSGPL